MSDLTPYELRVLQGFCIRDPDAPEVMPSAAMNLTIEVLIGRGLLERSGGWDEIQAIYLTDAGLAAVSA